MLPGRLRKRRRPADSAVYGSQLETLSATACKALYDEDAAKTLRKSHLNPVVKECYEWMGGEPGCHKAHELLRTSYVKRDRF